MHLRPGVTTYAIAWMLQTRSMAPSLIYTVSFSLRKIIHLVHLHSGTVWRTHNPLCSRDGYHQKIGIAIYHDTGPAYRDTYNDTYQKI